MSDSGRAYDAGKRAGYEPDEDYCFSVYELAEIIDELYDEKIELTAENERLKKELSSSAPFLIKRKR